MFGLEGIKTQFFLGFKKVTLWNGKVFKGSVCLDAQCRDNFFGRKGKANVK